MGGSEKSIRAPRLAPLLAAAALSLLTGCTPGSEPVEGGVPQEGPTQPRDEGWVGAWSASPIARFPVGFSTPQGITLPFLLDSEAQDQSFRMIVHPTIGGGELRIRLSNLMGEQPVVFDNVRVAKALLVGPALIPGTDRELSFGGQPSGTAPAGGELVSDPVDLEIEPGDNLAVSFHVPGPTTGVTWHSVSLHLSFVGLPKGGNTTGDVTGLSFLQPTLGWFFLSGVDVRRPDALGTVVVLGDSITDGGYIIPETNTRWTDFLAQRLQRQGIAMGVLNQGISGNTIIGGPADGTGGPNALSRFRRDVLERPNVRAVIILEGTNDINNDGAKADDIYAGLLELARQAHDARVCVVVSTVLPRGDIRDVLIGGWDEAAFRPQLNRLNELIRSSKAFDAVVDLATTMANPLNPDQGHPLYFVDGLHPNALGFKVMADAVPLETFLPPPLGSCAR